MLRRPLRPCGGMIALLKSRCHGESILLSRASFDGVALQAITICTTYLIYSSHHYSSVGICLIFLLSGVSRLGPLGSLDLLSD